MNHNNFAMELKWQTKIIKINKLKSLDNNPRSITKENKDLLSKDIDNLGIFKPLIADKDLVIIGGNKRFNEYKNKGFDNVEVSIPNRDLTEKERKEIVILDNKHRGSFDIDILMDEYEETIKDLGFNDVLPDFEEKQFEEFNRLDKKKKNICPKCGYES